MESKARENKKKRFDMPSHSNHLFQVSLFLFTSCLYEETFFSFSFRFGVYNKPFKRIVKRAKAILRQQKNYKIVKHQEPVFECRKLQFELAVKFQIKWFLFWLLFVTRGKGGLER